MLNAFSRTPSMMMSSLLEGNSSRNRRSSLGSAGLLSAVAISSLAACNIRWKYLVPALLGKRQPRKLPTVKVEATEDEEHGIKSKSISIILLHGMWQNATYFQELQEFLSEDGYTSYAVDLLPGERLLPGGSGQELVEDLECTLKGIEGPYVLLGHSKGGMIVQRALQQSEMIQSQAVGVVLMGSYPLGLPPPMVLFQQKRNMFQDVIGVLFVALLGKIRNSRYAKDIFLLQSTDETSKEISNYLNTIVKVSKSAGLIPFN
jgi:pimeloyl-ACP methyl ester carboxylesterase